jgi:hypothetical protein
MYKPCSGECGNDYGHRRSCARPRGRRTAAQLT